MEFTLHKQIKQICCGVEGETEVTLGKYRIDAVIRKTLYEVQLSSLSAIKTKIRKLCENHKVVVVKPIIARKRLVKLSSKEGDVIDTRWSPARKDLLNLFDELVYFRHTFPHPNLRLEVPLVTIEETRYPGKGRRRRNRKGQYQILDRTLVEMHDTAVFKTEKDLLRFIPNGLQSPFDTGQLAEAMKIQRWFAQKVAYCMRHFGAFKDVGKKGNSVLYEVVRRRRKAA